MINAILKKNKNYLQGVKKLMIGVNVGKCMSTNRKQEEISRKSNFEKRKY